jgi:hypothetical protein
MSRELGRIILHPKERGTLDQYRHSPTMPLRLVQRSTIVQMAFNGMGSESTGKMQKVTSAMVYPWRQPLPALRLRAPRRNAPRPGIQALEYPKHGLGQGAGLWQFPCPQVFYTSESRLNSKAMLMNFQLTDFSMVFGLHKK